MLELRLIRHALALGRHRNFARAAQSLRLTQPSLSRSIAALERELGVRLFDRTKDGARPTAFGELLLERGAALLEGEADFRREIQLLAGLEAGTLCIGAGTYPAEISVGIAAGRLLHDHPRLGIELLCADADEIAHRVLSGQVDVGICDPRAIADTPRLRVEPLPRHPLYLACRPGHPLTGRNDLSLGEVLGYPLATAMMFGEKGKLAASGRGPGNVDKSSGLFKPAIRVNALSPARQIARETDALFPGTAGMIARDEAEGVLVRLPFRRPELCTEYELLTLADRSPAPAIVAFITHLRSVESEIADREAAAAAPRKTVRSSSGRRGCTAKQPSTRV